MELFLSSCSNSDTNEKIQSSYYEVIQDSVNYVTVKCDLQDIVIDSKVEKVKYLDFFEFIYPDFMNFCEPEICCNELSNLFPSSMLFFLNQTHDLYISISLIHKDDIIIPTTEGEMTYFKLILGIDEISEIAHKKIANFKFKELNGRTRLENSNGLAPY